MTQFNPFVGSILQSSQVARQQAAAKAAQVRKAQQVERVTGLQEDQVEHQVESSEALTPTHDRDAQGREPKKNPRRAWDKGDDDQPHVDLTA